MENDYLLEDIDGGKEILEKISKLKMSKNKFEDTEETDYKKEKKKDNYVNKIFNLVKSGKHNKFAIKNDTYGYIFNEQGDAFDLLSSIVAKMDNVSKPDSVVLELKPNARELLSFYTKIKDSNEGEPIVITDEEKNALKNADKDFLSNKRVQKVIKRHENDVYDANGKRLFTPRYIKNFRNDLRSAASNENTLEINSKKLENLYNSSPGINEVLDFIIDEQGESVENSINPDSNNNVSENEDVIKTVRFVEDAKYLFSFYEKLSNTLPGNDLRITKNELEAIHTHITFRDIPIISTLIEKHKDQINNLVDVYNKPLD